MDVSRCEWLSIALFFLLGSVVCDGVNGKKEQECYNYAGGHVYPGEAFRVPVSDHSLHLSKAKSVSLYSFMLFKVTCMSLNHHFGIVLAMWLIVALYFAKTSNSCQNSQARAC